MEKAIDAQAELVYLIRIATESGDNLMCNEANCNHSEDLLDDDLTDIFGYRINPEEVASVAKFEATQSPMHIQACKSCRGTGKFRSYTGRVVGNCFTCKGTGQMTYKTSQAERDAQAQRRREKRIKTVADWCAAHAEEAAWMRAAAARGFDFAQSMIDAVKKYGSLTERQLDAVRRMITRDKLRAEEAAMIQARAPQITGAPLEKIEKAFATAFENSIKYPKLRLDAFIFSPVRSGKNAGAIYVKHTSETNADGERRYLGKIVEGRFVRSPATSQEEADRIVAAAMDPEAAAKAYGQREGACSICGRKLTKGESIDRAIGPICAEKYGWG